MLMNLAMVRRRRALVVFFFLPGMAMASWITRSPAIRDGLNATLAEMGIVLFGLSIGAMIGILISGWLVARLGTRTVMLVGLWLSVAALVAMGVGVHLGVAPVVGFGLFLMGLGIGSAEIAMNVDGADVEHLIQKSFLPALHGFFSLGTAFGALLGIVFTAVEFPVVWHLMIISAISVPLVITLIRHIPPGLGRHLPTGDTNTSSKDVIWKDARLYCLALFVLAMAAAEGAANDWLPLLVVDEYGDGSAISGSIIFLTFASAMAVGRFAGGFFLRHFGRDTVMCASAIIGAAGLAVVIFSHDQILAGAAVFLWGMGAALGFPLAISAAGDSDSKPTERVRMVAISGYIAFLVGPPMLGFVGHEYGLRNAMLIVLMLLIAAAGAAYVVRRIPHR